MAGEVLLSISKDKVERARLESEYKYAMDLQSRMVNARREGRQEGEESKAHRAAERALKRGANPEDVAYDLELPLSKVLEIQEKMS